MYTVYIYDYIYIYIYTCISQYKLDLLKEHRQVMRISVVSVSRAKVLAWRLGADVAACATKG